MSKRRLVFETQTKRFYEGPEPASLVENLRDSADHESILNGRISEYLMQGLIHMGVPTHFIRRLNMRETVIQHVEMLPFSVLIRNRADENYAKKFDFELGAILPKSIIEFRFHNSNNETHPLSQDEILNFELASRSELRQIMSLSQRVSDYLSGTYWAAGYFLVELSLEFGRQAYDDFHTTLMLADDIGPKQAQLWDINSSDENNLVRPSLSDVAKRFGVQ